MSSLTAERSAVETPKTVDPHIYNLPEMPDPHYDTHPAYGKCFPNASFGDKLRALKTLAPWMGIVMFKRAMLMDRIPALPKYKGHIQGGIFGRVKSLPRYAPYILKAIGQNLVGIFKSQAPNIESQHQGQVDFFIRTGFATANLSPEDHAHVNQLVSEPLEQLMEKRADVNKLPIIDTSDF